MSWHFTCQRLKTRHQTTVDMCLNRKRKPDLFPECRGCKVKLRQPVKYQYQDDEVESEEEDISKYLKMIQKRAWELLKPSPLNESHLSDLISEGMVAFYETIKAFDCTKGNGFSTYFWPKLNLRLSRYIRRHLDLPGEAVEGESITQYNQHDYLNLLEVINGLSARGKQLIMLALDGSIKPTEKNFSLATGLSGRKITNTIKKIRKRFGILKEKQNKSL